MDFGKGLKVNQENGIFYQLEAAAAAATAAAAAVSAALNGVPISFERLARLGQANERNVCKSLFSFSSSINNRKRHIFV